jgi:hypothetical protein
VIATESEYWWQMKIEVLEKPPMSGRFEEVHFDALGECTWVKFSDDLDEWIGVFGKGSISQHIDLAVAFDDDRFAFVVAGGQGYIIEIAQKRITHKTANYCIQGIIAIPEQGMVLACDYTEIELYDSNSRIWKSNTIALDGIELYCANSDRVIGSVYNSAGWDIFEFDVESKTVTGQNLYYSSLYSGH